MNGLVHIVGAGTTTITADTPEDDTYRDGHAEYTLTVIDPSIQEKTYTKVTSISEGTYLLCGYENAGTYICLFPPISDNKCDHNLYSSSNKITEIKTKDPNILGSEVEITQSESNWLIKVKAKDQYMYFDGSKIAFTSDESLAKHTIGTINSSTGKGPIYSGENDEFYHSGSNAGFLYKSGSKGADNIMFFKLSQ